ncbi:MAG TPA: hypothetical protein VFZ70_17170 [Euzebyales bacterium]
MRWNEFGTPQSLINYEGFLSARLDGDGENVARTWLRDNAALFQLTPAAVNDLTLVRSTPLGDGRAVLLTQRIDGLPVAGGGLVSLAIVDGRVAYVSSSIVGDRGAVASPSVTAERAVRAAAADVGRRVAADQITRQGTVRGWERLAVDGFTHPASARQVALPLPQGGVVPAYETFILDNSAPSRSRM